MASSSSPSLPITVPEEGYDVFISFRGEDTRNNFTSHLYAALHRKQIKSFIDSKHPSAGDEIPALLRNAIEGSKFYLVIFSPNYASSKWCLSELEMILECKKMKGKTVMPVFYKVEPSNVRYQTGSFRGAFLKHEEREEMERVQRWRAALNEASNLSGWDCLDTNPESELVENIGNSILEKLNKLSSTYSSGLVGIDLHVENLKSLLCMESPSPDVCSVGIWGMGGIGKTTIARVFFGSMYLSFNGFFFANVREEVARHGVDAFKIKFFQEILDDKDRLMGIPSLESTLVRDRLRSKKVLIVLDDVDDSILMELRELKTHHYLFGVGSKVVMTSRDKRILEYLLVDKVYRVTKLNHDEAVQLFSQEAFKDKHPPIDYSQEAIKDKHPPIDYMELVERVVNYAEGNPLALKVFGSALFGQSEKYWRCALDKIEKFPKGKIEAVLRFSYDGLSTNEQNIFLDIACFFKGVNKDCAIEILDNFRDVVYSSIINLIDKCLVTIFDLDTLEMHHLLQEMGRVIAREESINPENRSRLHDPEEICDVLTNKKDTQAIQSINLDLSKVRNMHLPIDAFVQMDNLQLLKVSGWDPEVHSFYYSNQCPSSMLRYLPWKAFKMLGWDLEKHIFGHGLQFSSKKLRYFHWEAFPSKFLTPTLVENLVKLSLPKGNFERLWTGAQHLVNLRWLDLSWCKYLTEIPDLTNSKNIESIYLHGCVSLVTLHSSVQHLTNLKGLSLRYCSSLKVLPSRLDSKTLQWFYLSGCLNLRNCPYIVSPVLEKLFIDETGIKEASFFVHDCKSHQHLDGYYKPCMTKFPEVSSTVFSISLRETAIEEVPSSIQYLNKLYWLTLFNNQNLSRLPTAIWELKTLNSLSLLNCPKLEALPEILLPMEEVCSLQYLDLSGCYNLKALPNNISDLKSLGRLEISNCKLIRFIPPLPRHLFFLAANDCESLETLSTNCNMREMWFENCYKLDEGSRHNMIEHARIQGDVILSLPGTEIPQRFPHRSVGSSITVPWPSNSNDSVRIAFCIVYQSISSSYRGFPFQGLKIKCYDEFNNSVMFKKEFYNRFLPEMHTHHGYVNKCNHLLLGNFRTWKKSSSKCSKASIEFCTEPGVVDLVKQCGIYFHFGKEYSDSSGEEYSNSSYEDCSESMGEEAHSKGGCDDNCPNDAEVSTSKRATDEVEEEKPRPTKKIKTQ